MPRHPISIRPTPFMDAGTVGRMQWTPDTSAGDWLRERIDDAYSASMHAVVPRGFPAYARILHPASVRSMPGGAVPTPDEWEELSEDERSRLLDRFVDEPTTWSETAAAFGTTLHPLAQWQRIVRTPVDGDWHTRISPDGREFTAPVEGTLPHALVSAIASHLIAHTTTPDAGYAALWEGWGDLLGHLGHAPTWTAALAFGDDSTHRSMLGRSVRDPFNNVFRRPTWQEGILSREVSEGARFRLPARDHVLFRGAVTEFADSEWLLRVPWRDLPAEAHGLPPAAQSPSLVWPDDHAWVMVGEVDYDSTIVAGTHELVAALCADDRLEAFPIREDADLTWDADEINR